jgi:hypothetical protein
VVRGQRDGRHRIYEIDGASFLATLERILAETRTLAAACCPPVPAAAEIIPAARLRRR